MKQLSCLKGLGTMIFIGLTFFTAQAQITSTTGGGDWNQPGTWVGGIVPGPGDEVVIDGTVNVTTGDSCLGLTVNVGKTLQNVTGNQTLYVGGSITNNGTITDINDSWNFSIDVAGNITINGQWDNQRVNLIGNTHQHISMLNGNEFAGFEMVSNNVPGRIIADTELNYNETQFSLNFDTLELSAANDLNLSGQFIKNAIIYSQFNRFDLRNTAHMLRVTVFGGADLHGTFNASSDIIFNDSLRITDTIQNFSGSKSVQVNGPVVNNGVVRNGPDIPNRFLELIITGDVTNNGSWSNDQTVLEGAADHNLNFGPGSSFSGARLIRDSSNVANVNALTALAFTNTCFDLNGSTLNLLPSTTITLNGAKLQDGTVITSDNNFSCSDTATFANVSIQNPTAITGGIFVQGLVQFSDTLAVSDSLVSLGSSDTVVVNGNLHCSGSISSSDSSQLTMELYGNLVSLGDWDIFATNLSSTSDQTITQGTGKTIRSTQFTNTEPGSDWIANSDLSFATSQIDLKDANLYMPMNGTLLIAGESMQHANLHINNGTLTLSDSAYLNQVDIFNAITLEGKVICDSNIIFNGAVTLNDTLTNIASDRRVRIKHHFTNNGDIRDNGSFSLQLEISGNIVNNGSWENAQITLNGTADQYVNLLQDQPIYSSSILDAKVSGASTFQWYLDGNALAGETASQLTLDSISKSEYGLYHCVTDLGNSRNIKIGEVISLGPDRELCDGDSVLLTPGAGFAAYDWNGGLSSNASLTVSTSGTYIVTITNNFGYMTSDTIEVIVHAPPTVSLGNDTAVCIGQTVTLDAGSDLVSYDWSTGATTQMITVSNAATYSVTVLDSNNCTNSDAIVVGVNALPNPNLGPDTSICAGTTFMLNPGSFASYDWQDNFHGSTLTANAAGTYWVTVSDMIGCTNSDTLVVAIDTLPVVSLRTDTGICAGDSVLLDAGSGFSAYSWNTGASSQTIFVVDSGQVIVTVTDQNGCRGLDSMHLAFLPSPEPKLGNDSALCDGFSLLLDPGVGFTAYEWQDASTTQTFTAKNTGSYWVEVTGFNNCVGRDTINLIFHPLPVPDLGKDTVLCENDSYTLDAGPGFASYDWSTGASTSAIIINMANTYSLTVTDSNGCKGTDEVVISNASKAVVDLGNDVAICDGDSVLLDAGAGWKSQVWNTGSSNQTIYASQDGAYSVEVQNNQNCTGSDTIQVTVHPLPLVDLGPDVTIFDDQSASLDAGPGFASYAWSDGSGTEKLTVVGNVVGAGIHTYHVTVTNNNGCINSDTIDVTVEYRVGIDPRSKAITVAILPNPNEGQFVVQSAHPIAELQVLTVHGQVVLIQRDPLAGSHIDLSAMPQGCYLLSVSFTDGQRVQQRVVVY